MAFRELKKRIKIVNNTGQITRAMAAVSANKMKKSQNAALNSRPYCIKALNLLAAIIETLKERNIHKFLDNQGGEQVKTNNHFSGKTGFLIISSDKGLCGSFNSNVFKKTKEYIAGPDIDAQKIDFFAVGRKAAEFLKRQNLRQIFSLAKLGDITEIEKMESLFEFIFQNYRNYSKIICVYTNFISTLRQEAVVREIFPINRQNIDEIIAGILPKKKIKSENNALMEKFNYEYLFEPSPKEILEKLVPALIRVQIYHLILESNASEHSARMMAMQNASDNAGELLKTLTLEFNKARQAAITNELLEVISGAEAMKI